MWSCVARWARALALGPRRAGRGAVRALRPQRSADDGPLRRAASRRRPGSARAGLGRTAGRVYVDYDDREPQALARWYALAEGIDQSRVVRLPDGGIPPIGAIAFGRAQECDYAL